MFALLACTLYLGAGAGATWPSLQHADSRFLAAPSAGHGEAAPGDHLQTLYHLWLVGDQLEHGHAPWLDPYSFRPESRPTINFAGWPFGLAFWPLQALLGFVRGWNAFILLTYLAAGGLTCLWLRTLGLARGAALAGGLAFAIAPYRVAQSTGHLLGPIAVLLPLALYALERRRNALAVAAVASIPLSGQVHLALGAIPFVCAYALVRQRDRRTLIAVGTAVAAAVAAGLLVKATAIDRSHLAGGRPLAAVSHYSAHWSDLIDRHEGSEPERFVFLGWATPVLAAVGLALLWRRQRGLALVLFAGAIVPILLALGTQTPLYSAVRDVMPPLRYPRVPERLMSIACLSFAALVAAAVARTRQAIVAAAVVALLFVDLRVHVYAADAADEHNAAYAALRGASPGRVLELPVFFPDLNYGSVYLYYDMQARRERPAGYSTVAPSAAYQPVATLFSANCGRLDDTQVATLRELGVRYVAVHSALFRYRRAERQACESPGPGRPVRGLPRLARSGEITIYEVP
jgi:hypothetical protein